MGVSKTWQRAQNIINQHTKNSEVRSKSMQNVRKSVSVRDNTFCLLSILADQS